MGNDPGAYCVSSYLEATLPPTPASVGVPCVSFRGNLEDGDEPSQASEDLRGSVPSWSRERACDDRMVVFRATRFEATTRVTLGTDQHENARDIY